MQKKESISNTSYYSFGQIQDTNQKCAPTAKCQFLDSHSSTQPNSIHLSHLNREKTLNLSQSIRKEWLRCKNTAYFVPETLEI